MSSNEEYLDNLLKSMEDADGLQGTNSADEMRILMHSLLRLSGY